MPEVKFGRKDEPSTQFETSDDLVAVRTRAPRPRASFPVPDAIDAVVDGPPVLSFPEANVEVYRVDKGAAASVESAKTYLNTLTDVRFAGRVLREASSGEPAVYTENIFIKFTDETTRATCLEAIAEHGLTVKREVDYAPNAFFVAAPDGTGQKVFDIALMLLERDDVEFCHPEIVGRRARKGIYPQQWHLARTRVGGLEVDAHARVAEAHELGTGSGITIAIIDDGIDIDHIEFADKLVAPRDMTLGTDDPRPKDPDPRYTEDHGTACAGVACAAGRAGACGVAPDARLMPIRLSSALGAQAEGDAFFWAARNGADIISCSWGPPDGKWTVPDDPYHWRRWDLPASTRLAIDYAVTKGREGKGCLILFAAGNGGESVDLDGYASYPSVVAVAACNDRGVRSGYSDYGQAIWCAFPSNDSEHPPTGRPRPLTPGIWTTDRGGVAGYNPGRADRGDPDGHFTSTFGGTSSACPGVAGVAALILSVRPELEWTAVRSIIAASCEKVDRAGANYDGNGWSPFYGHGRVDARAAVELALADHH